MKHEVELFVGIAHLDGYDNVTRKVNTWLNDNAEKIEVVKIEHQQSFLTIPCGLQ